MDTDPSTGQTTTGQNARRYVALAGPNWTDLSNPPLANPDAQQVYTNPIAILVSNVVGVYQTVVTLDRRVPWIPVGSTGR